MTGDARLRWGAIGTALLALVAYLGVQFVLPALPTVAPAPTPPAIQQPR